MRILVDMQGAQSASRHRGIGRYSLALVEALVRNRGQHEVLLLLNGMLAESLEPIRAQFAELLPRQAIHVWQANGPVHGRRSQSLGRKAVAEQLREAVVLSLQPDLLLVTSMVEGYVDNSVTSLGRSPFQLPTASIFYDAVPLLLREVYLDPEPDYQPFYLEKCAQLCRADLLLAISESARREATDQLAVPESRVVNISSAVSSDFQVRRYTPEENHRLLAKYGIAGPFLMYSGGVDERKNLQGMLRAYARLDVGLRTRYRLVIVGGLSPSDAFYQARWESLVQEVGLAAHEVCITGRVTDAELIQFYNLCQLFVFPSTHEGFGLPALEALSCGAAVIGSNTSSIPEVIGLEEALFDPRSEVAIADKIQQALSDHAFYQRLKANAGRQASRFSWDTTAKRAWDALLGWFATAGASERTERPGNAAIQDWLLGAIATTAQGQRSFNPVATAQALAFNFPPVQRQLLVDVSELVLGDARTGVQRVVRAVVRELLVNAPPGYQVRLIYGTPGQVGYRYANRFAGGLAAGDRANAEDLPIDYASGDVFLGLDMQLQVQQEQAPFYQHLRRMGVSVHFVLHDLLPVLAPGFFPPGLQQGFRRWLLTLLAQADGVVCVSQTVAGELRAWSDKQQLSRQSPLKIRWFHNGADLLSSLPSVGLPDGAEALLQRLGQSLTFLMVGTLEPRKGHAQVLSAFERLWAAGADYPLVVVGKRGWQASGLAKRLRTHPEQGRRLFWLQDVSDEYLERLYRASSCLIAASEGEGFGLPLIEAAQHGLPIIARALPVFREVGQAYLFYFEGLSPQDLEAALNRWLQLYSADRHPKSQGMPWQKWRESTAQLLQQVLPPGAPGQ